MNVPDESNAQHAPAFAMSCDVSETVQLVGRPVVSVLVLSGVTAGPDQQLQPTGAGA